MSGLGKAQETTTLVVKGHGGGGISASETSPPQDAATDVTQSNPQKVAPPKGGRFPFSRRETSQRTLTFDPYAEEAARQAELASHKQQSVLQPNRRKGTQLQYASPQGTGETANYEDGRGFFPENISSSTKFPPKPLSPARLKWWIGICVAFTVLAPVIAIVMGATLHAREMKYPGPGNLTLFNGRTLDFEVVLISADPKAGMMRLDWRVLRERNSACRQDNLLACTEVDIYFDTNLLKAEGTFSTQEEILSSNPPDRPIFKLNATALVVNDPSARTPTFRTQLALFSPERGDSSLLFYPFDVYTAEIIFFARENRTGNTVGVSITKTRGIAVGFETEFGHTFNGNVPPGLVEATITLTRSTLVKSYSIVSTIAIWLITIILALVMITTVFFGFKQRGEVLLIPVATLFAFTQLRQSMPGAPEGFGDIVDLVGLVPCLALLALTAAFSLGAFILTDPTNMPRQINWRVMHDAFPSLKPSPKEEKEQKLEATTHD